MKSIRLNTSVKAHFILGSLIALWLVVFQILIAPFDVADLTLKNRMILIPPYGLIMIICYMITVGIQNLWYIKQPNWNYLKEAAVLLFFYVILLFGCYRYYITEWVNGTFPFWEFVMFIYLPIVIIFTAFIVLGRMYLNKLQRKKEDELVRLVGTNQNEFINLTKEQLICVSSAQNYVEVLYKVQDQVKKQLLRGSLKQFQQAHPELTQIHRSHLVNTLHFVTWKDKNTALFFTIELPVSKNYKQELLNRLTFST